MTLHIHRVDGEYRIVLSEGEMEALRLADGDPVTVVPGIEEPESTGVRYATLDQVREAQRNTLPLHSKVYAALAK